MRPRLGFSKINTRHSIDPIESTNQGMLLNLLVSRSPHDFQKLSFGCTTNDTVSCGGRYHGYNFYHQTELSRKIWSVPPLHRGVSASCAAINFVVTMQSGYDTSPTNFQLEKMFVAIWISPSGTKSEFEEDMNHLHRPHTWLWTIEEVRAVSIRICLGYQVAPALSALCHYTGQKV